MLKNSKLFTTPPINVNKQKQPNNILGQSSIIFFNNSQCPPNRTRQLPVTRLSNEITYLVV